MKTLAPSALLRRALLGDAAGSLDVAALQLAAAAPLAALTQLPALLLAGSGLVMAVYGALLLLMARRTRLPRALVPAVIVGNVGWALGALLVGIQAAPALPGLALLAVHALWTLLFAALQQAGLSRSVPAADQARGHNGALDDATLHTR